ncbi:MAG: serine hydrolase [Cyclobacteriaceae bacterium]
MNFRIAAAAALFIIPSIFYSQEQLTDSVDAFLLKEMRDRNIPGLQFAIVQHGKIIKLNTYGFADLENSVKATNQTIFPINSITKSFTGVAIMQLVEAGKLDITAPLSRYLDDLPQAWGKVPIQNLLNNTSGIPDAVDTQTEEWLVKEIGDEGWNKTLKFPIEFPVGEKFRYNQTNFILLGLIIDKLSGKPFTQFIKENQFAVAGMTQTTYDKEVPRAKSYVHSNGKFKITIEEFPKPSLTAAGLNSTAEEIAKWVIALQNGQILKQKQSLTTLWTPGVLNDGTYGGLSGIVNGYALGWPVKIRVEHPAIGGVGGARSAFFVYPEDDLTVIILSNKLASFPETFIDEVAGFYVPGMKASTGFGLSPAAKKLRAELMKRGFDQAQKIADELKAKDPTYRLTEVELNSWGYTLIQQEKVKEAIEIFKLNVSLYPQSGNAHDSLGEAYMTIGDKALAIKNYKRSLELDPNNGNAKRQLKRLK